MKLALLISVIIFFLPNFSVTGQDNIKPLTDYVSYGYDFAGNRVSRFVVILGNNAKTHEIEEEDEDDKNEDAFKHNFGAREIHVYPNPVKSNLNIEIWNGEEDEKYKLLLLDISGKLLMQTNLQGNGNIPVDMSRFPSGIYILIIDTIDGKIEYKIIKEK